MVESGAALALTQADSPDPVQVGENVTYTVQVHNGGPDDAEAVTLTDTLPGATTFQSATPSTGTCSKTGGTVTCDLGLLAADDDASVAITVRADAAGTISNAASVSSTTDDPDDSDNTAVEQTTVVEPGPDTRPNIVMVITDDQAALDGRLFQFEPTVKSIFVDHGVNFTDFHSETPLCCPARAGFFTGLHTHNHHVTQNRATQFDPTETIATELNGVGYHTMLIGKYLNQYSSNTCKKPFCAPHVPPGWDKWVAFGEPNYYKYDLYIGGNYVGGDPAVKEHHESLPADYSTDVIASNAVSAIEAAPAGKPIFAWIAPYGPHAPGVPARATRARPAIRGHGSLRAGTRWTSATSPSTFRTPHYARSRTP